MNSITLKNVILHFKRKKKKRNKYNMPVKIEWMGKG